MAKKCAIPFLLILFHFSIQAQKVIAADTSCCAVTTDIPLDFDHQPTYSYKLITETALQLKLDSLNIGYDSLEIRIWASTGNQKRKIILFAKKRGQYIGKLYGYSDSSNGSLKTLKITQQSAEDLIPISGWDNFFDSMNKLEITKLPDMSKIHSYPIGADGWFYSFEIATKHYYRFYDYWIPEELAKKIEEAKKVTNIIKLIKTQFGVDLKR